MNIVDNLKAILEYLGSRLKFGFFVALGLIASTIFLVTGNVYESGYRGSYSQEILIIGFILALIGGILPVLIKFLSGDIDKRSIKKEVSYGSFLRDIEERRVFEKEIREALVANPDLLNVEATVYERVISNLEASLINKLDDRFTKGLEAEFVSNAIFTDLLPLKRDTERYIDRIQRNSIVNLIIGIIGTVTSITILSISILSDKVFVDIGLFLMNFLPRITFVIFIQLFAFFFLRLYKNNLEDAKYFQNELTNLSARSSALRIAYLIKNEKLISEIVNGLSNTERNFKLQKEETLLNIEKAKIEKDFDLETISAFKDFLKNYRKE